MAPRLATARQEAPAAREGARPEDVLERLRGVVGPAGAQIADGLLEAVRAELKREYERGYHDGWASFKNPTKSETGYQRWKRRTRRHLRHSWRAWWATPKSIPRTILRLVVITVLCCAAVGFTLKLTQASHDKKWAPPTITW